MFFFVIFYNVTDIGDLCELLQDLNEMAPSWFSVGLFLKISYGKLEIIRRDNRDQCSDCLREMLATWLQSGKASAADIVHSLRSSGRSVLAKKMAVKHGKRACVCVCACV